MNAKKKTARGGFVLAGGAAIQLLAGIPAGWGAFGPGVEKEYAFSTGQTILIFSLIITAFGIGCVLGGALQDHFGARAAALPGAFCLGGGFFAASFFPTGRPVWFCLGFSLPVGLGCALLTPSVMSSGRASTTGTKEVSTSRPAWWNSGWSGFWLFTRARASST